MVKKENKPQTEQAEHKFIMKTKKAIDIIFYKIEKDDNFLLNSNSTLIKYLILLAINY